MTDADKCETYLEIYKELSTIKWIGADEGWDLAIRAVRSHLKKMIHEHGHEIVSGENGVSCIRAMEDV